MGIHRPKPTNQGKQTPRQRRRKLPGAKIDNTHKTRKKEKILTGKQDLVCEACEGEMINYYGSWLFYIRGSRYTSEWEAERAPSTYRRRKKLQGGDGHRAKGRLKEQKEKHLPLEGAIQRHVVGLANRVALQDVFHGGRNGLLYGHRLPGSPEHAGRGTKNGQQHRHVDITRYKCVFFHIGNFFSYDGGSFLVLSTPGHAGSPPEHHGASVGPGRGPWHVLWGFKVVSNHEEAFRARRATQAHANPRTG